MNTLKKITINPSFERGGHSVRRLQKKREGTAIIPTPKSATDERVGFGAKLTFPADKEDDKSVYNHRENAEEPTENPKPRFHRISSRLLSRTFRLLSSVKLRVF